MSSAWTVIFTNPANNYVSLVSTPLYFYDFLLTFGDEVRYVWRRRFSGATLLFAVNRYASLLACAVNAFGLAKCHFVHDLEWWKDVPVDMCKIEIRLVSVCTIVTYCAFAGFTALRMYALYGLRKWIFWVILVMGLITPTIQILIAVAYEVRRIYIAPGLSGCFRESRLQFLVPLTLTTPWKDPMLWQSVYMVLYETILVGLTWYKTLGNFGSHVSLAQTPVMALLRRDGTLYFLWVFCLPFDNVQHQQTQRLLIAAAVLNIVGLLVPGHDTSPLNCIGPLADTLSSMFMSYFILRLRTVDKARTATSRSVLTASQWATLQFANAEAIVGNLGESLRDENDEKDVGDDGSMDESSWDDGSTRDASSLDFGIRTRSDCAALEDYP